MHKVLAIALANLLRFSRDRSALITFLFMPLLLIGILGLSLGGLMNQGKISPFDVILVNADQAVEGVGGAAAVNLGQLLTEKVLNSEQAQEILRLQVTAEPETAREEVRQGKAVAAILVPADYTASVLAGQPSKIQLLTDPGRPTQVGIITQIVSAFTDRVSMEAVTTMLAGPQGLNWTDLQFPGIESRPSGLREVGAMAYYAAGMAVMYMLMSAIMQAKLILQDRASGLLDRVRISPIPRGQVVAGQMLSSLLLISCQFLILLIGSHLLYRVDWGPWLPVLLIGLAFALAASGISVCLATLFRDQRAADASVGLLGMLFGALSGSMFPLYGFPDGMRALARLIPNYWALQGFLDQMAGLGPRTALLPIMVLCAIGISAGGLGARRLLYEGR